jgi:hypothetical protein
MRSARVKLALSLAGAASFGVMLASPTPASAADLPSGLTFWSGAFTGQTVNYENPSIDCETLPFTAHAEFNNTSKSILVYSTTDCTGQAIGFPAYDIHSFITYNGRSFRAGS